MRLQAALTCAIWIPAAAGAQTCAVTPEAAAQSVVGAGSQSLRPLAQTGFRVQDVQVDSVLHRVWFRVGRCDDPRAPLVLVPLRADVAGVVPLPLDTPKLLGVQTFVPLPPRVIAVHSGDPVTIVFASSDVHMELEGTADQQGSIGDALAVTLRRRGDEPPHRMHGVLRADHRVEVLP